MANTNNSIIRRHLAVSVTTVLTIAREGNKLTLQQVTNTDNKVEMLPESQTDFFMIDQTYTTFSFVKDETGQLFKGS